MAGISAATVFFWNPLDRSRRNIERGDITINAFTFFRAYLYRKWRITKILIGMMPYFPRIASRIWFKWLPQL